MKHEREIFEKALDFPAPDERAAFLREACAGDVELQERVQNLLRAHEQSGFLREVGPGGTVIAPAFSTHPIEEGVGTVIGRYKLLQQIGSGGMGVVYMAEQREPVMRKVALKIIKLGMDTRQVVARFEAERQALALMDHPNIARVLDAGATDAGRPYFVMELVHGARITEYCDQNGLTTRERLELFTQVCQAIQHAHQKGIIHRDIKPSNVLVTMHDGVPVPKIIDFGIAKATNQRLTEKTLFTEFGMMVGTPAYMSPEQTESSGLDVDTRADIYSLGVLLYELLTGITPFTTEELFSRGYAEMQRIIAEKEPMRPSTRLSTLAMAEAVSVASRFKSSPARLATLVRGDLDWIAMKCLEKDRRRRYETASSLAADIQRHVTNEPVQARPPSAAYRFQKAVRRNKLAFAAGGAVATALVLGLTVSTWAMFRAHMARTRAVEAENEQRRERINAERARETATLERDRAAILLSHAQAGQGVKLLEKSDPVGLLHLLASRKSVEHLPEERARRTLLWSGWMESLPKPEAGPALATNLTGGIAEYSDRPWRAMVSTNGEVTLRDAVSGATITTFQIGSRTASSPELSTNGRLLVVNANGAFQLWNLTPVLSNQSPLRLLNRISRFAFDPNGQRLVTFANQNLPLRDETLETQPGEPAGWKVQIWDSSAEPPLIATWSGNRRDLVNNQFALNPDGTKVAASWKSLTLWDARTGQPLQPQPRTNDATGGGDFFIPPVFSPNGRWLWEFGRSSCVRYDVTSSQAVGETVTNLHRYKRPWVSPNKQHLVLTLENGFQVVELDNGRSLGPLIPNPTETAASAVALSHDGRRLATSGTDRAIRIWDTRSGQATREAIIPPFPDPLVTFSPDRRWLTIAAQDGRRQAYRVAAEAPASARERRGWQIFGFNSSGQLLVHTVSNRMIRWVDPATDQDVATGWELPGNGAVISSDFSPNGKTLATATETTKTQSLIQFWDTTSGMVLEPAIPWTNLGSLAFNPDGKTLAGLGGDGSIHLWDSGSGDVRAVLNLPKPWEVGFYSIRFSPDGNYIATQTGFKSWHLWDRNSGLLSERTFYTAISPDWKLAQAEQGLVDLSNPREPRPAPESIRGGMAFSKDGRLLAVSLPDNKLRLWDVTSGSPVGHEIKTAGVPYEMEFSLDGRLLVILDRNLTSGRVSSRGELRLWDTATGLPVGRGIRSTGIGTELCFDRDSRLLVAHSRWAPHVAQFIRLPAREVALEEMEQQSWLLAGSRLDAAGNLEAIPADEWLKLEAAHGAWAK